MRKLNKASKKEYHKNNHGHGIKISKKDEYTTILFCNQQFLLNINLNNIKYYILLCS